MNKIEVTPRARRMVKGIHTPRTLAILEEIDMPHRRRPRAAGRLARRQRAGRAR